MAALDRKKPHEILRNKEEHRRQKKWRHLPDFDPKKRIRVKLAWVHEFGARPWFFQEDGVYYYRDEVFVCRDCGQECVWKAEDQQWWYERCHASDRKVAVRCPECRKKEHERKAKARQASETGMAKKRARQAQNKNEK
jgi:predicted RNA-binding Zn-ribbon protein involved in translation (DUF1610 family)